MTLAEKRRMAEMKSAEELINLDDSVSGSESGSDSEDEDLSNFSRSQLMQRIKQLKREVNKEKAKNDLQKGKQ